MERMQIVPVTHFRPFGLKKNYSYPQRVALFLVGFREMKLCVALLGFPDDVFLKCSLGIKPKSHRKLDQEKTPEI